MCGVEKVAHFNGETGRLCVGDVELSRVETVAHLLLVVHMKNVIAQELYICIYICKTSEYTIQCVHYVTVDLDSYCWLLLILYDVMFCNVCMM